MCSTNRTQSNRKSAPDNVLACANHTMQLEVTGNSKQKKKAKEGKQHVPRNRASSILSNRFRVSDVNQEDIICKECSSCVCAAKQHN